MNRAGAIILAVVVVVLVTAAWLFQVFTPRLEEFSPADGDLDLPPDTMVTFTFSRPMDSDTVLERIDISPDVAGEWAWEGQTVTFTPNNGWPRGAEVTVNIIAGARSDLGLATRQNQTISFTINRPLLVYLWPADRPADIFALEPITGETHRLTQTDGVISFDLDISGEHIYYSAANNQGGSDIWLLDRIAGETTHLLDCEAEVCGDLQISPNERWLAFSQTGRDPGLTVWLLEVETGEAERLSEAGHEARLPLWSPDGKLSYYDADEQAYIILDRNLELLHTWDNQTGEAAAWSPDGRELVAPELFDVVTDVLRGPSGENSNEEVDEAELDPVQTLSAHLLSYSLSENNTLDLTRSNDIEDLLPTFSPNGSWLAFTRKYLDPIRWTIGRQIWLARDDGSSAQVLTDAPNFKYTALAWHPDSRQLAAVRANTVTLTDPPEIWLIDIRTGEAIRLVIGGYAPQWIP